MMKFLDIIWASALYYAAVSAGRFHRPATLPPRRVDVYAEVVRACAFRELRGEGRQQGDEALLDDFLGCERRLFLGHQGHDLADLPCAGTPGEQREIAAQCLHIIYIQGEVLGLWGERCVRRLAVVRGVSCFVAVVSIILVSLGGVGQYLVVAPIDIEYDFTHVFGVLCSCFRWCFNEYQSNVQPFFNGLQQICFLYFLAVPLHRQPKRHNVVAKGNAKSPTDEGQ